MKQVRKQFSNFTQNQQKQYSKEKLEYNKRKNKMSKEERKAKLAEIELYRKRLENAKKNIGNAHHAAVIQNQKEEEQQKLDVVRQKEREILDAERYDQAIQYQRENDPNKPFRERVKRMQTTKKSENNMQKLKREKYVMRIEKEKEEEREQQKLLQQKKNEIYRPKLYLEDYAKTFYHADIGLIPVNNEAIQYQKEMEKSKQEQEEKQKKQERNMKRIINKSIKKYNAEKDAAKLEKELEMIKQIEINENLEQLNAAPQKKLPAALTYNIDDRNKKRQERIQRFLVFNDEAPKPKGPPPQPQPMSDDD
ncbi:hypothetical protein GPJ56_007468 [Histomonas meleagridis]|uniref:uncharacterized protein n=1 Tax=Histomonas meleagridis TaxID=135588 RepID=UPI003559FD17|nr:hypothetical protein GPJ56_007468 [Histomonas meleagridis]KAH0804314.1 hypothetical protein GO595_003144 [Histomonas meleagridis]